MENNFPKWLDNVFLSMLQAYDLLWDDETPTEISKIFKKNIWLNYLKKFKEETIYKAVEASLLKFPKYPPKIGEFVNLCEEFAATSKYIEYQIEDKSEFVRSKEMPEELRKKIALLKKSKGK